uniref:Putative secreted peptide n=1 Tax=Anopheles braziliensis TaxID=58242 RepID=A0A2M3ZXL8_9DIPT
MLLLLVTLLLLLLMPLVFAGFSSVSGPLIESFFCPCSLLCPLLVPFVVVLLLLLLLLVTAAPPVAVVVAAFASAIFRSLASARGSITSSRVSFGTALISSTTFLCVSVVMLWPFTSMIRSPCRSPAPSAGEPSSTLPMY